MYQSDRALSLSVARGHSVVVRGYLGEPFLRLDDAGLAVNAASPTSFGTGLLPKGAFVSGKKVAWRLQPGRRSVVWHDTRVQGLPPGVTRGSWSVPIVVDGRPDRLAGRARPHPAARGLALGGAALVPAVALVLLFARRRRALHIAAVVFASVGLQSPRRSTALGFALDTYASPGTWIAGLDELVFVAVGVGVLAWGPPSARAPAAIGLGALSAAVGISKGAVFLHPVVLSVVPGRALTATHRARDRRRRHRGGGGRHLGAEPLRGSDTARPARIETSQRSLSVLSGRAARMWS